MTSSSSSSTGRYTGSFIVTNFMKVIRNVIANYHLKTENFVVCSVACLRHCCSLYIVEDVFLQVYKLRTLVQGLRLRIICR